MSLQNVPVLDFSIPLDRGSVQNVCSRGDLSFVSAECPEAPVLWTAYPGCAEERASYLETSALLLPDTSELADDSQLWRSAGIIKDFLAFAACKYLVLFV